MDLPKEVIFKIPDDGLSGKSDEDKLGVTYKDITKVSNGEEVNKDIKEKIEKLHNRNIHKFNIPTYKK